MLLKKLFRIRENAKNPEGELVKPFLEHLEDLRLMLMRMAITLGLAMVLALVFRVELVQLLISPLRTVDGTLAANLQSLDVTAPFTISFKLAFYAGIVISFPFLLFFVGQFIFPALTPKEQRMMIPALLVGTGLFLTGVLFAFLFLLPQALNFFIQDARKLGWQPNLSVVQYFSFVTQFTIAFGLSFEMPVVVMMLVKLGILSHRLMVATRAYAVVAIIFLSAVITPTPDILTLLCLAGPLLLLYEVCIWLAWLMERKEKKRIAMEEEEDRKRQQADLAERGIELPPDHEWTEEDEIEK